MATLLKAPRRDLDRFADAFAGFAPSVAQAGSLRPTLIAADLDPDAAEAFAGAVSHPILEVLSGRSDRDLSQLVVLGMCVGLQLRDGRR